MVIRAIESKDGLNEGGESDDHVIELPAATLWVIQPPPPPEMLLKDLIEKINMSQAIKTQMPSSKFFSALKKTKVTAKEMDASTVNNYLGNKNEKSTFQASMKVLLVCGQVFGLNPVLGITDNDASKLRFTYLSWRFVYSIVLLFLQVIVVILSFNGFLAGGLSFDNAIFIIASLIDISFNFPSIATVIFYTSTCLVLLLFIRVAKMWPELAKTIARSERMEPCKDLKLTKRCNITCLLVLSMALFEHSLSDLAGIAVSMDCRPELPVYEAFIETSFPWAFTYITYNNFIGFLAQFLNLESTFNWNFADLFIICMSHYLSARFDQINDRIYAVRGKYLSNSFWKTAREDYCRVTHLVRAIDDVISPLVFISFANNLYFICHQLFHTLEDGVKRSTPSCNDRSKGPLGGHEHAIYFVVSFVFLVSRSLAVSIYAARVHSAAKTPAGALYDVPSPTYTIEVQRFLEQVCSDTVAFSGLQFFKVTRGLVLTVAGTIVTYELVLVQFNSSPTAPEEITPTAASTNLTS